MAASRSIGSDSDSEIPVDLEDYRDVLDKDIPRTSKALPYMFEPPLQDTDTKHPRGNRATGCMSINRLVNTDWYVCFLTRNHKLSVFYIQ